MFSEEWKPVPGFPRYEVSNLGRVRSHVDSARYGHGWRIKTPARSNKGLIVGLSGDTTTTTMSLQRLVATTWLSPPPSARHKWVAFKDGNHDNYAADNLEWVETAPSRGKTRRVTHNDRTRIAAALKSLPHKSAAEIAALVGVDRHYVAKLAPGRDYSPRDRSSPSETSSGTPPTDAAVEEWRAIPSSDGYDVSSFGRVRSWHGVEQRVLALQETPKGYLSVTIGGRTLLVHRLVADAFCEGRSEERSQVNHKDGDITNNFFENLEWLSAKENSKHSHDTGLWAASDQHGQRLRRPPVSMYDFIRMATKAGASVSTIASQHGWDESVVACLAQGNAWANEDPGALPDEQWKPIPGSKHEISSCGRVRRAFNGKLLKLHCGAGGYPAVTLPIDHGWRTVRVHRLVAMAFVPRGDSPRAVVVNHKDGDKENTHHSNLEWCTPAENTKHAHDNGLIAKGPARPRPAVDTPDDSFPREEGEEWRRLPDPGYFVSSFGRVLSTWRSTRLLATRGRFVAIAGKHQSIADLVASAFLPPPPSLRHVPVPKDGDVNNCAAANLAWGLELPKAKRGRTRRTPVEPLGGSGKGSNKGRIKDNPDAVRILRQVLDGVIRPSAAARTLGVTCGAVVKAVSKLPDAPTP